MMEEPVSSTTDWDIDSEDAVVIKEFVRDNVQVSLAPLENIRISNPDEAVDEDNRTNTSGLIQETASSGSSELSGNLPLLTMDCDFESLHKLRYRSADELVAHISELFNWMIDIVQKPVSTVTPDTSRQAYYLSCVLWLSQEAACDLSNIITVRTFNVLLDWTLQSSLKPKYTLMKHAVDKVLCSMYAIRPDLFNDLLQRLGIILPPTNELTDGATAHHQFKYLDIREPCFGPYNTTRLACGSTLNLTETMLRTLSTISLSFIPADQLISCGFLALLVDMVMGFITFDETNRVEITQAASLIVDDTKAARRKHNRQGFKDSMSSYRDSMTRSFDNEGHQTPAGYCTKKAVQHMLSQTSSASYYPSGTSSGMFPTIGMSGDSPYSTGNWFTPMLPLGLATSFKSLGSISSYIMPSSGPSQSTETFSSSCQSTGTTPGVAPTEEPINLSTLFETFSPARTSAMDGASIPPTALHSSRRTTVVERNRINPSGITFPVISLPYLRGTTAAVNTNPDDSIANEVIDLTQSSLNTPELEHPAIDSDIVSAILIFFSELSWQNSVKMWFGSEEIVVFWERLLIYLCITIPTSKSGNKYSLKNKLNAKSVSKMEDAAIMFFYKCCSCCPRNQDRLAQIIYNVLDQMTKTSMKSNGIMDFTRRVLLELVIGPDSVYVSVETDIEDGIFNPQNFVEATSLPPSAYPLSRRHQFFYLSTDCTCSDIVEKVINDAAISTHESGRASSSKRTMDVEFQSAFTGSKKIRLNNKFEISVEDLEAAGPSKGTRAAVEQISPKLLLWAPTDLQYVNVNQHSTVADMLRIFVPNGDELEVPVIKFFLTRNAEAGTGEILLSNKAGIPPSLIFTRFVELRGVELVAQHIESKSPPRMNAGSASQKKKIFNWCTIPMHSLIAFGQFSRLPEYRNLSEVRRVLRPVYGLREEASFSIEKNRDCFSMNPATLCKPFGVLPFELLSCCFRDNRSRDGTNARANSLVNFLLMYLALYTHQPESVIVSTVGSENKTLITALKQCNAPFERQQSANQSHAPYYWPKGTGYSSGYSNYFSQPGTSSSGDSVNQRLQEEEELVTSLFQVLAVYINPRLKHYAKCSTKSDEQLVLPPSVVERLKKSCLRKVLVNYLRNESVLDIVRHVPLYKAIMQLLRVMAFNPQTTEFLTSTEDDSSSENLENSPTEDTETISIVERMWKMKACADVYIRQLSIVRIEEECTSTSGLEMEEKNLMLDIRNTAKLIDKATKCYVSQKNSVPVYKTLTETPALTKDLLYLKNLKTLQLDSFDMITEAEDMPGGIRFNVDYHYSKDIISTVNMVPIPARMKRLAQETASLATSLPFTSESAIFVRCDSSRLDVMKVLITGPPDTPYMNGCFEFDVFFPLDYPISPMLVNLKTTGKNKVRFNPNLYACGKVCLSLLNTWGGGAQEMWNSRTSNLIQVLVSIQALVFVPQPYFNEPGYEMSRGDSHSQNMSKDYNEKLMPHTVKWAMLDQIQNPNSCFKDVIQAHFWLKKEEIKLQVTQWMNDCDAKSKDRIRVQADKLFVALERIPQPRFIS